MTPEQNEATVARIGECFVKGDLAGVFACLSPDVVWTLPAPASLPYGGRYVGHDGYADWYRRVRETLHFNNVTVTPAVGQADQVVLLGKEQGIAIPTGRPYGYDWAQVYTFDADGLLTSMYQYFDPSDILAALAVPGHLPAIPDGLGLPFYYSSLINFEVMYLVDAGAVANYLAGTGLSAGLFGGRACVSYNFQSYTGQFPGASGVTQEIEFNIVAYPDALQDRVVQLPFRDFVTGNDQTKLLGNHRVHVPCDSDNAIAAGVHLFGEPKFKTSFAMNFPSLNDPSVSTWSFTCNDPVKIGSTIFSSTADLTGLAPLTADISPQTEYGLFDNRLIGCRWNILQPHQAYLLPDSEAHRVWLTLGDSDHPMRSDLAALIGDTPAAAVRTFRSAPAAIQSRAYFV